MHQILLLFCVLVIKPFAQEIHHLRLTRINNMKYQCIGTQCSSSQIITVSNVRRCETACLSNSNCRTITFDQTSNECEIFSTFPSQFGGLIAQENIQTLIANSVDRPPITSKSHVNELFESTIDYYSRV